MSRRWIAACGSGLALALAVGCGGDPSSGSAAVHPATVEIASPGGKNQNAAAFSRDGPRESPAEQLEGRWQETWGVGQDTDVDYHDIYAIDFRAGRLEVTSEDNPYYVFEEVRFRAGELYILMNNTQSGDFFIEYRLRFRNDDLLVGTALTVEERPYNIHWERL